MAYLAVLSADKGRRAGCLPPPSASRSGFADRRHCRGARPRRADRGLARAFYEALRWAGIAYLLWLAWEGWRGGGGAGRPRRGKAEGRKRGCPLLLRAGSSPTCSTRRPAIFYVAILPMHLDPARPLVGQSILIVAGLCRNRDGDPSDDRDAGGLGASASREGGEQPWRASRLRAAAGRRRGHAGRRDAIAQPERCSSRATSRPAARRWRPADGRWRSRRR